MYNFYNDEDDKILNAKEHQERALLQEKKEKVGFICLKNIVPQIYEYWKKEMG